MGKPRKTSFVTLPTASLTAALLVSLPRHPATVGERTRGLAVREKAATEGERLCMERDRAAETERERERVFACV